jgi:rRNA processing protein Gar1
MDDDCSVSSLESSEVDPGEIMEEIKDLPYEAMDDLAFVAQIVDLTKNSYYASTSATLTHASGENLNAIPENVFPEREENEVSEASDDDCFESDTEEITARSAPAGSGRHGGRDEADDEETIPVGPIRTVHELVEVPIEKVSVVIPSNESIVLIGEVVSQISLEHTVVIKSVRTDAPLDEGSLLCLENRLTIGTVNEVFGPLNQPFYVVKGVPAAAFSPAAAPATAPALPLSPPPFTGASEAEEGEVDAETEPVLATAAVEEVHIAPGTKIFSPIGPFLLSPPPPLATLTLFRNDFIRDASVPLGCHQTKRPTH